MKRSFLVLFVLLVGSTVLYAQDAPNVVNASPQTAGAQQSSKLGSVPVNIFTGMPIISVPIYNYSNSNSGISWGVSLSYFSGGVQMLAQPAELGLGWSLNATSAVTRTVRGMPDDIPSVGFMYAPPLPTDFRSDGDKYYNDTLDTQQDIFQFSLPGGSGNFYIGKNQQIVVTPLSKIKITPILSQGSIGMINGFRIITEDGVRYDFTTIETSYISGLVNTQSGYANTLYNSAWYLAQVIAPFNTDTIRFNYLQTTKSSSFDYPQTAVMRNADAVITSTYTPTGTIEATNTKINSIVFPDKKTLSFTYVNAYSYSGSDSPVVDIKVSDTGFLYGYKLGYKGRVPVTIYGQDTTWQNIRLLLTSVNPYTAIEMKDGYKFTYLSPNLKPFQETPLALANQRDYWGFHNSAVGNGTNTLPQVNGVPGGANRTPNFNFAKAGALAIAYLPDGGYTFYEYELNDHYPYIKDPLSLSVTANTNSQNNITLNQVFTTRHQLRFSLDNTVLRIGASPVNGSGNLICTIKSTDGITTYATQTISLHELFYQGLKTWSFTLPNGTYRLETQLSSGTSISISFPMTIQWENKLPDFTTTANVAGGLRVKSISRRAVSDDPGTSYEEYRYITEDGKSSGFLGDVPKYDYPYSTTTINGSTTITPYTVVNSEPVSNLNYAQGSPVGYSRVEVIKGTVANNLGKTVYEFTDLNDVNSDVSTSSFPYAPQDVKSWGIGLPKKIMLYDKNNVLIKKTVNVYGIDTISYTSTNHKSIKLGKSSVTFYGDPANSNTYKVRSYVGQEFYPTSGRVYLVSTNDTMFHSNGSLHSTYQTMTYDTNYNVTKVVSGYDRTRNLQIEKRMYYPYNYTIGGAIGTLRTNGITEPVISTETWITGDANPRMLLGTIADFQALASGHIVPSTIYSTESNSPIPQSTIGTFNPAQLNRNTTYFKPQQSFSSYDSKGNVIEVQSPITGRKNAVLMDYDKLYPIAKVSNAAINEVAYTSFESDGTGNWIINSQLRDTTTAITGKRSYNLNAGYLSSPTLNTSIPYVLTLWAKAPSGVSVNGVLLNNPIATQNGWELFMVEYPSIASIFIDGYGRIDELRLHPKNANMVTTTYSPGLGLVTSSADANNTIVYNEYDNLNRIKIVRDKDKNIISRFDYQDVVVLTNPPVNTTPNWVLTNAVCSNGTNGWMDSTFYDMNPNSPTYNQSQIRSGLNYCLCSTNPQYKTMANGMCELGIKVVTSSVYGKQCDSNGVCVWKWKCTYHYEWSDGSFSQDYIQFSASSCPLGPDNS
jgi:hypothetical protein